MKILLIFILLLITSFAYAFDESNEGQYAVVRQDGQVTDYTFKISQKDNRWILERKAPDGSWEDVTCSQGCSLEVSHKKNMKYFASNKIPKNMSIECIHNDALAFCSIGKTGQKKRAYMLIGLIEKPFICVPLSRVEDSGIEH